MAEEPYFAPDAGYHYSNTNTVLLGLVAEKLTGQTLQQLFEHRIFKPLGMTHTSLPPRPIRASRRRTHTVTCTARTCRR